jgi:hypothetical protein
MHTMYFDDLAQFSVQHIAYFVSVESGATSQGFTGCILDFPRSSKLLLPAVWLELPFQSFCVLSTLNTSSTHSLPS